MDKMADVLDFLVNEARPEQTITLTVIRGGEQMDVEAQLGTRPFESQQGYPMR